MDDYRKRAIGGVMALDLEAIKTEFDAAADIDNDDMREDRSYCARHIPALVARVAELEAACKTAVEQARGAMTMKNRMVNERNASNGRVQELEAALKGYQDLYGRVEREGEHHNIRRGVIQATVFVHSYADARDSISEVDLCEVSGSVPMDFLLWWEDRHCAEDVTECFEAVRSDIPALDEAYAVEVGYAWTWRGDHDYDYGWLIERVTPLGTLYPYRGGE